MATSSTVERKSEAEFMRPSIGVILGVLFISSPAFSQPSCDDAPVLQELASEYVCSGLMKCAALHLSYNDLKVLGDTELRERLKALNPNARVLNEVDAEIANWHYGFYIQALTAAAQVVVNAKATPSAYDPNLKLYTCHAALDLDEQKLIATQFIGVAAQMAKFDNGRWLLDLNAVASMNDMAKWRAVERFLTPRYLQMAQMYAACVQRRVTFTVQPSRTVFSIDFDPAQVFDQVCLSPVTPPRP